MSNPSDRPTDRRVRRRCCEFHRHFTAVCWCHNAVRSYMSDTDYVTPRHLAVTWPPVGCDGVWTPGIVPWLQVGLDQRLSGVLLPVTDGLAQRLLTVLLGVWWDGSADGAATSSVVDVHLVPWVVLYTYTSVMSIVQCHV